jgi:hypothetical protein
MPTLEDQARTLLRERIARLEDALRELGRSVVRDGGRPIWIEGCDKIIQARDACAEFVSLIDYTDDLDPGGTERLQGLVGSSEDTLRRVHEVNEHKRELHEFLMCLDCGVLEAPRGRPTQRDWTTALLTSLGRARFNRRQATRSLVILEERPVAASYFWGKVRKIIRITRAEARELLEKRLAESEDRDPALRYQYETLLTLPEDEPLAQVQQLREYPRVNLVFEGPGGPVRKQVMASSPMFYPADPFAKPPEIIPLPDPDKKRKRLRRSDLAIEIRPFLPAIRVHRYLDWAKKKSSRGD